MYTRVMPALLIDRGKLVKTKAFRDARYIGDPRNAVRIFNARDIDELVILDISAGRGGRPLDWALLRELAEEAFVPAAYGGGIRDAATAERVLELGFEKVVLCTEAMRRPEVLGEIAAIAGRQAVVASLDFLTDERGDCYPRLPFAGNKVARLPEVAKGLEDAGAGELLLHDVSREGLRCGYNISAIAAVTARVRVPVIALGGAHVPEDLRRAVASGGASAVAAGSMFVLYGRLQGVLISFPSEADLRSLLPNRP